MRIFFPGVTLTLLFTMQSSKKLIPALLKYHHLSVISSTAVQIFYLQEELLVSNPAVQPEEAITDLAPTFVSSNKYAWSAWIYQISWNDWGSYVRISLNKPYLYVFSIIIMTLKI